MADQQRRGGLGGWLRGLRFPGFSIILGGVLVIGVAVIAPTLSAVIQQRQQIAALQASVAQTRAEIDAGNAELARWKDPAYVRSQARDRLFYVMPGETQLLTIDDIVLPAGTTAPASDTISQAQGDWLSAVTGSILIAGTTSVPAPASSAGDPAAGPAQTPAPTTPAATAPAPAQ